VANSGGARIITEHLLRSLSHDLHARHLRNDAQVARVAGTMAKFMNNAVLAVTLARDGELQVLPPILSATQLRIQSSVSLVSTCRQAGRRHHMHNVCLLDADWSAVCVSFVGIVMRYAKLASGCTAVDGDIRWRRTDCANTHIF
jgi:hypothetical protein